jgi:tRNA pseudouridine55 synthase
MRNAINGWLILDKPVGMTSAQAVARVKRILKPQKIGHAGTLDPLASGVLPLALGEATKTVNYMMDASKSYAFTVSWGAETTTDDKEGSVTHFSQKRPSEDEIRSILPQFIGDIIQTPPQFSALKVDGKRAYDLARAGQEVEIKPRQVRVNNLILNKHQGDTDFICHCGKGTYIRSLGRDMGRLLGCYGHISYLRRLKVGQFEENHAISLEKLEEMVHKGDLGFMRSVASALDDIPAVSVTSHQSALLKAGQFVSTDRPNMDSAAAFEQDRLVAIVSVGGNLMKPKRVFHL